MRVLRNVLVASAVSIGIVLGVALPAQAADAWVYVVVNNGVCSAGSEVRGILINDTQSGFTTTAWDNGDNIVYPRVRVGVRNQLNIQACCEKQVLFSFWQPTGFRTVVAYIAPRITRQTFWVG